MNQVKSVLPRWSEVSGEWRVWNSLEFATDRFSLISIWSGEKHIISIFSRSIYLPVTKLQNSHIFCSTCLWISCCYWRFSYVQILYTTTAEVGNFRASVKVKSNFDSVLLSKIISFSLGKKKKKFDETRKAVSDSWNKPGCLNSITELLEVPGIHVYIMKALLNIPVVGKSSCHFLVKISLCHNIAISIYIETYPYVCVYVEIAISWQISPHTLSI